MLDLQKSDLRFAMVNSAASEELGAKAVGIGVLSENGLNLNSCIIDIVSTFTASVKILIICINIFIYVAQLYNKSYFRASVSHCSR